MQKYVDELKTIKEVFDKGNDERQVWKKTTEHRLISKKTAKSLNKAKDQYNEFGRQNAQLAEDRKHLGRQLKDLSKSIENVLISNHD